MLGASVSYPVRGAVTWKSIVGTNVPRALSYLASAGVIGGALIVLGETTARAASCQERSHAYALKSMMWLLDPRPNLTTIHGNGRARFRAFGSVEHTGNDGAPRARMPRPGNLRRQQ